MSRRTSGSPPVRRILLIPRSIIASASLCSSSRLSTSLRGRNCIFSGMQYEQRKSQRSVTDRRK
jgi:hypothetical protein